MFGGLRVTWLEGFVRAYTDLGAPSYRPAIQEWPIEPTVSGVT